VDERRGPLEGMGLIGMTLPDLGDALQAHIELSCRRRFAGAAAIAWTGNWYRTFAADKDLRTVTLDQIAAYCRAAA